MSDGVDNDCDGDVDEGLVDSGCLLTWYLDQDGDGVGGDTEVLSCDQPSGAVAESGDCDDGDEHRFPGNDEVCGNALDEDCDGKAASCRWAGERLLSEAATAWGEGVGRQSFGLQVVAGDATGDGAPDLIVGSRTWPSGDSTSFAGAIHVFDGTRFSGVSLPDASYVQVVLAGRFVCAAAEDNTVHCQQL